MGKKYLIGTSGWNYPHWKERFYPENIRKKDWLTHYSGTFDTVEINYSFYRWPSRETLERWRSASPSGFKFTLKAPRMITHIKRLKDAEGKLKDLYSLGKTLKDRMGCYLFQLPPDFRREEKNTNRLERFLKALDGRKNNVIEFRHKSWWGKDTYDLLKENNTCFCTVSGLGMPDDIIATSRTSYFRFHGSGYATRYTTKKLEMYARAMKKAKVENVYAYFNNDKNAYAPQNAQELKRMIRNA